MSIVSDKVLRITTLYMGPASSVFLDRQMKHLAGNLTFSNLQQEHLPKFLYWIQISGQLILKEKADLLLTQLMREFQVKEVSR